MLLVIHALLGPDRVAFAEYTNLSVLTNVREL